MVWKYQGKWNASKTRNKQPLVRFYPCFHIGPAGMTLVIHRIRSSAFSVDKKKKEKREISKLKDRTMHLPPCKALGQSTHGSMQDIKWTRNHPHLHPGKNVGSSSIIFSRILHILNKTRSRSTYRPGLVSSSDLVFNVSTSVNWMQWPPPTVLYTSPCSIVIFE